MGPSSKPTDQWQHEFKNQLGIILGFSEVLLREMDAGDPHRGDIDEIRRAVARAIELLAGLLSPRTRAADSRKPAALPLLDDNRTCSRWWGRSRGDLRSVIN